MKLRSLLISALLNVYALCPVWGSFFNDRDDQQASSSAAPSYSLKTLPNDIMTQILLYTPAGPFLHRLWETGDKTMQQRLSQNVQIFTMRESRGWGLKSLNSDIQPKQLPSEKPFFVPAFHHFVFENPLPNHFFKVIASRFPSLTTLDIPYDEEFEDDILPNEIALLTQLRSLNLSGCHSIISPHALLHLTNLTELNASGNEFEDGVLPNEITSLSQLRRLNLAGCSLIASPHNFLQLTNLTELNMSGNHFVNNILPDAISLLSQLKRLNLAWYSLIISPYDFFQLTNLTELNMSGNRFVNDILPDAISLLSQLKVLTIHRSELTALPANFSHLTTLTNLDISHNIFTQDGPRPLIPLLERSQLLIVDLKMGKRFTKLGRLDVPEEFIIYKHILHGITWDDAEHEREQRAFNDSQIWDE